MELKVFDENCKVFSDESCKLSTLYNREKKDSNCLIKEQSLYNDQMRMYYIYILLYPGYGLLIRSPLLYNE